MIYVLTALITLILDQLSKCYVLANFELHHSSSVIGNFLSITYSTNTGGAFSILNKYPIFFILLSTLLMIGAIVYIKRILDLPNLYQFALGLILGGAAGNLIDRFRFGSVIDFIDFSFWPTFNVADIGISVGVSLMVLNLILYKDPENPTQEVATSSTQGNPIENVFETKPAHIGNPPEIPMASQNEPAAVNNQENPQTFQNELEKNE